MTKQQDLGRRQVLCVIGNRYVVFGPMLGREQRVMFEPERDSAILPRVPDESDFDPERLVRSLRIYGMELTAVPEHANFPGDLALTDREGLVVFIDVKVRSHSPKSRDLNAGYEKIRFSQEQGRNLEVWHFNTERLNLLIQSYDRGMPIHCEIAPVDVWETTDSGIFRRDQVVAEVARWEKNVKELYEVIINWYNGIANVTFELSRTVCMSEEMMQKYAVSDRELPILDILSEGHVLASFVPRGLWLIGAWGRIDIITPTQTRMLVMLRVENQSLQWHIVSHDNRRETKLLTRELMQQLLEVR